MFIFRDGHIVSDVAKLADQIAPEVMSVIAGWATTDIGMFAAVDVEEQVAVHYSNLQLVDGNRPPIFVGLPEHSIGCDMLIKPVNAAHTSIVVTDHL